MMDSPSSDLAIGTDATHSSASSSGVQMWILLLCHGTIVQSKRCRRRYRRASDSRDGHTCLSLLMLDWCASFARGRYRRHRSAFPCRRLHLSLKVRIPTCRIATSFREGIEKKALHCFDGLGSGELVDMASPCRGDTKIEAVLRYIFAV